MEHLNRIGLDTEKSQKLAGLLNELLANYSTFYQNTRGYHWNIRGDKFFVLHIKFEELYNDLILKIDEVAERILTLGHSPSHKYTDYLGKTGVKESDQISDGQKAVEEILAAFKTIILKQREILKIASDSNDEGTSALMSDYIREQEKMVWMYSAHLNENNSTQ